MAAAAAGHSSVSAGDQQLRPQSSTVFDSRLLVLSHYKVLSKSERCNGCHPGEPERGTSERPPHTTSNSPAAARTNTRLLWVDGERSVFYLLMWKPDKNHVGGGGNVKQVCRTTITHGSWDAGGVVSRAESPPNQFIMAVAALRCGTRGTGSVLLQRAFGEQTTSRCPFVQEIVFPRTEV